MNSNTAQNRTRFETVRTNNLWAVAIVDGNKKKGTKRIELVSEYVYTHAQAQCFINNNRVADFNFDNEETRSRLRSN